MHSFEDSPELLSAAEAQEILRRRLEGLGPGDSVPASEIARILGVAEFEMRATIDSVRVDIAVQERQRKRRKFRDLLLASMAGAAALVFFAVVAYVGWLEFVYKRTLPPPGVVEVSAVSVAPAPPGFQQTPDVVIGGYSPGIKFIGDGKILDTLDTSIDWTEAAENDDLQEQILADLRSLYPTEIGNHGGYEETELRQLDTGRSGGAVRFRQVKVHVDTGGGQQFDSSFNWPSYQGTWHEVRLAAERKQEEIVGTLLQELSRKARLADGGATPHRTVARAPR